MSCCEPALGALEMAVKVLSRTEGLHAFNDGLPAALLRQITYGGMFFASYSYLPDAFADLP